MSAIDKRWAYDPHTKVHTLKVYIIQQSYGGYSLNINPKKILHEQVFYGMSRNDCLVKLQRYQDSLKHQVIKNNSGLLKYI